MNILVPWILILTLVLYVHSTMSTKSTIKFSIPKTVLEAIAKMNTYQLPEGRQGASSYQLSDDLQPPGDESLPLNSIIPFRVDNEQRNDIRSLFDAIPLNSALQLSDAPLFYGDQSLNDALPLYGAFPLNGATPLYRAQSHNEAQQFRDRLSNRGDRMQQLLVY